MESNKTKIVSIVAVIIVIALIVYATRGEDTPIKDETNGTATTTDTGTTTDTQVSPATTSPAVRQENYKDGTYTATGTYVSPGGPESIEVTLTLKDDIITSAEVVSKAVLPTSKNFQGKFISGYKAVVVGKNIESLALDKVSGSSLTPKGFNDAVLKIKAQAQS